MIVTDNFDLQTISSQMDNSLQIIENFLFAYFNIPDWIKKRIQRKIEEVCWGRSAGLPGGK